jgi:uncharacterized surface protein with fasciclin (FAS1) repeats
MIAGLAVSSGLMVGSAPGRSAVRASTVNMANIVDTAKSLQGPVVFWGADGPAIGKEESDIRGYDNFEKFVKAVTDAGLAGALSGPGPFTVFAPTDAAFADFTGEITADILKNHVVPGVLKVDQITGDLTTLQGSKLIYGRRFRKTFLDYAMVGIVSSGPSKGQVYPCDVKCDNGIIHSIDTILVPGAYKA